MSEERRQHARIALELACRARRGDETSLDVTMRDVSAVGAKLVAQESLGDDLAPLIVEVPAAEGYEGFEVPGRVMYSRARDEGVMHGIQFTDMDAAVHGRIKRFIAAVLDGSGGGQRQHPRVVHRTEVTCRTRKTATAVLQDISKGGVRIAVPDGVDEGEPIEIAIRFGKGPALTLSGKVLRTKSVEDRTFAAIKLDPLSSESDALLSTLLKTVVGV